MNDAGYKLIVDGARAAGAKFPTQAAWLAFKAAIDGACNDDEREDIPASGKNPDAFPAAFKEMLKSEGGYVNDPRDPGGMTNLGVTRRVWEAWTHKASSEAEMRALTPDKVAPLYRAQYWMPVACDRMPPAIAYCVFDFAVNAGVNRAARYVQRVVGVTEDGHVGPATLAALNEWVAAHGVAGFLKAYAAVKTAFYRSLPTFPVYGKGWLKRVGEVEAAALRMANG